MSYMVWFQAKPVIALVEDEEVAYIYIYICVDVTCRCGVLMRVQCSPASEQLFNV